MSVARQVTIHVALNPDQNRKLIRGKVFERYGTYPSLDDAIQVAGWLRSKEGRIHPDHWTISEVVDCGARPGRDRYAIFVRKGRAL